MINFFGQFFLFFFPFFFLFFVFGKSESQKKSKFKPKSFYKYVLCLLHHLALYVLLLVSF